MPCTAGLRRADERGDPLRLRRDFLFDPADVFDLGAERHHLVERERRNVGVLDPDGDADGVGDGLVIGADAGEIGPPNVRRHGDDRVSADLLSVFGVLHRQGGVDGGDVGDDGHAPAGGFHRHADHQPPLFLGQEEELAHHHGHDDAAHAGFDAEGDLVGEHVGVNPVVRVVGRHRDGKTAAPVVFAHGSPRECFCFAPQRRRERREIFTFFLRVLNPGLFRGCVSAVNYFTALCPSGPCGPGRGRGGPAPPRFAGSGWRRGRCRVSRTVPALMPTQ